MLSTDVDVHAYAWLLAATLAALALYRASKIGSRQHGLPPGPPTTPLLGNLLTIPPRYAHLYFQTLSKQYGPIVSLKLFGHTMVVLNNAALIRELLDKRSNISSERPAMHINDALISRGAHILLVDSKRNAVFRKLWNATLAKDKVADHVPLQTAESAAVLYNIAHRPDDFYHEMRRYSASLTLAIAFGKRTPTFAGKDASGFSAAQFYDLEHRFNFFLEVGAAPPLDLLPVLKWLPGAWKRQAADCRRDMVDMYCNNLYRDLRAKMDKGVAMDCWMQDVIRRNEKEQLGLSEEALAWQGGVMMEGGSDTTSGALLTFTLAALLHPNAVRKAQAELDAVVGQDRRPTLDDADSLPYCMAFIREVMRWRPVAPAGVPHVTSADVVLSGYAVPKGTVVVGNTWAVLHDEAMYDRPDDFMPERFLAHPYGLKPGADDDGMRWNIPYGAGRRICLGMWLAENSLKITIPNLLWAFTFSHKMDAATGKPIPVSKDNFEPGHLTAPVPFACDIRPRSEEIAATIERDYTDERGLLDRYEVDV